MQYMRNYSPYLEAVSPIRIIFLYSVALLLIIFNYYIYLIVKLLQTYIGCYEHVTKKGFGPSRLWGRTRSNALEDWAGFNKEFGGIMSLGQAYLKADIRGLWRTKSEPSIRKHPPLENLTSPTPLNIFHVPGSNFAEIRSFTLASRTSLECFNYRRFSFGENKYTFSKQATTISFHTFS